MKILLYLLVLFFGTYLHAQNESPPDRCSPKDTVTQEKIDSALDQYLYDEIFDELRVKRQENLIGNKEILLQNQNSEHTRILICR